MKQDTFERQRKPVWDAFEAYIEGVGKLPRSATSFEIDRFLTQYKSLNRDLALAQSRGYSQGLIEHLNDLVNRGHQLVHVESTNWWEAIWRFMVSGFPSKIREAKVYVTIATFAFLIPPAVLLVLIVLVDPSYLYSVVAPGNLESIERMYDPSAIKTGRERDSDSDFSMFGFYIINNIGIALRTFAWGILFGVGSILILCFNGVYIGAITYHLTNIGYSSTFYTFVIAHGAFELTALVFSGAAGLMVGYSLLVPGRQTRMGALKESMKKAIQIMIGVIVMLALAAFIEAFWSSSRNIEDWVKYAVGAILWVSVAYYFIFVGRRAT